MLVKSDSDTLNAINLQVLINPLTKRFNLFVEQIVKCTEVNTVVKIRSLVTFKLDNCLTVTRRNTQLFNVRRLEISYRKEHDCDLIRCTIVGMVMAIATMNPTGKVQNE